MSDVFENNTVEVEVLRGGRILPMDPDNCLGRLEVGYIDLHIKIRADRTVAFMVDGYKNITLKREEKSELGRYYRRRIQIKQTNPSPSFGRPAGVPHTEYPLNALRLIEVDISGVFRVWNVGVVSQRGVFFVLIQDQYEARCYMDGDSVRCPYFEEGVHHWPQLLDTLPRILKSMGVMPATYRGEAAESDFTFSKLMRGTAGVEYWDVANGFGGLVTDTGVRARVHWTSITREGDRRAFLVPGEIVSYKELVPPMLTKNRPTKYKWEAREVRSH